MATPGNSAQWLEDWLRPLRYHAQGAEEREHAQFFQELRAEASGGAAAGMPSDPRESAQDARTVLDRREQWLRGRLGAFYQERRALLVEASPRAKHPFEILHAHTRLVDALYRFVYGWALDEVPLLLGLLCREIESQLNFAAGQLAQKEPRLRQLRGQLPAVLSEPGIAPEAGQYYVRIEQSLAQECEQLREQTQALSVILPALRDFQVSRGWFDERLVAFARGGYGRGELSFASDLDTGYCVDPRGLPPGADEVLREVIVRMEALLHAAGLNTAHQFFELGEDLSRFAQPQTQHTVLSILESRTLAGNASILRELQAGFLALMPLEKLASRKLEEFEAQKSRRSAGMNLKEDSGGLRSIQIPLWLIGLTYQSRSFAMADLLALAREKGLLSLRDTARLAQSLALWYELRNFLGSADGSESPGTAIRPGALLWNESRDAEYAERSVQFGSAQVLRRERLRTVDTVKRISLALLSRVLDRTVMHEVGPLRLTAHLSSKRITAIQSAPQALGLEVSALLNRPHNVLLLFGHIAETGYDLSDALKETLADWVRKMKLSKSIALQAAQMAAWNGVVSGTSAHRAVATLFEINEPLPIGCETLISKFIPALARLHYHVAPGRAEAAPAHAVAVRALEYGQRRIAWLRDSYPEWSPLVQPRHWLGLKWSLLLHGLGQVEPAPASPARSAELAADALASLGNRDEELERLMRLLIQHHLALAEMSRTSAYLDRALAEFFVLAERDVVQAILLVLVNLAVLEAKEDAAIQDVENLLRFFDEAMKILAGLRAIPSTDRSIQLINVYLDGKKQETEVETRLHVVLNRALAQGLQTAVYLPLQRLNGPDWKRLAPETEKLDRLHQQVVVGRGSSSEQERLVSRLFQALRHHIGAPSLEALTSEEVTGWLFASFPNRYLLRASPAALARLMVKFTDFRAAPVLADVVLGPQGSMEGLLIAVRRLTRPHTRVAYALGLKRVNILSGKVNRVDFGTGDWGYCYYFEVNSLKPGQELHPRDLEALIVEESTADRDLPREWFPAPAEGTRVRFLDDDGRGYEVAREEGGFVRRAVSYEQARITRRDEPFLFHRLCRAFDSFGVEWRQALITTTGNLVVDYFSLLPADAERLRAAGFEEALLNQIDQRNAAAGEASGA